MTAPTHSQADTKIADEVAQATAHGSFVANNNARQIVCEEWQRAVKEFNLTPGMVTETVVSRIVDRLDDVRSRYPALPLEDRK